MIPSVPGVEPTPGRKPVRVSRRAVLLGGAAGLALAGCGSSSSTPSASTAFSIAHRGGGGNWPEMTLYAYQQASKIAGLSGMEVSVHLSKDGVLVCNHDADTSRLGSRNLTIAKSTWAELSSVMVSAKATTDPSQPARPLARLDDLLDWWPSAIPLWIEPKVHAAVVPLRQRLRKGPTPTTVVWKQPLNRDNFAMAHHYGWRTWGYVLSGAQQRSYVEKYVGSADIDMLGVWKNSSDADVAAEVALAGDKPSVMWQINNTADRDRALRLGCRGLMVSNVKQLVTA